MGVIKLIYIATFVVTNTFCQIYPEEASRWGKRHWYLRTWMSRLSLLYMHHIFIGLYSYIFLFLILNCWLRIWKLKAITLHRHIINILRDWQGRCDIVGLPHKEWRKGVSLSGVLYVLILPAHSCLDFCYLFYRLV